MAVIFFAQTAFAQRLSIQYAGVDSFPTTVALGTTDSILVQLVNDDSIAWNGTIAFQYSVNGSAPISASNSIDSGLFFAPIVDSIAPGTTSGALKIDILIEPDHFQVGPSVVIIWPFIPNAQVDSLIAPVTVLPFAGIERQADNSPELYFANKHLVIQDLYSNLKRVRIYDLEGRLLMDNPLETSTIMPLNGLSAGTYFAEVLYGDNQRKVLQFVNQ